MLRHRRGNAAMFEPPPGTEEYSGARYVTGYTVSTEHHQSHRLQMTKCYLVYMNHKDGGVGRVLRSENILYRPPPLFLKIGSLTDTLQAMLAGCWVPGIHLSPASQCLDAKCTPKHLCSYGLWGQNHVLTSPKEPCVSLAFREVRAGWKLGILLHLVSASRDLCL